MSNKKVLVTLDTMNNIVNSVKNKLNMTEDEKIKINEIATKIDTIPTGGSSIEENVEEIDYNRYCLKLSDNIYSPYLKYSYWYPAAWNTVGSTLRHDSGENIYNTLSNAIPVQSNEQYVYGFLSYQGGNASRIIQTDDNNIITGVINESSGDYNCHVDASFFTIQPNTTKLYLGTWIENTSYTRIPKLYKIKNSKTAINITSSVSENFSSLLLNLNLLEKGALFSSIIDNSYSGDYSYTEAIAVNENEEYIHFYRVDNDRLIPYVIFLANDGNTVIDYKIEASLNHDYDTNIYSNYIKVPKNAKYARFFRCKKGSYNKTKDAMALFKIQ